MTTACPPLSQTLIDSIEDYGNQHNSKFAFERWEKVGKSWMAVMWHKKKHVEFNVGANSKTYSAFRNKLGSAFRRSYRKANMTPTRSSALIAMQSATSPTAQPLSAASLVAQPPQSPQPAPVVSIATQPSLVIAPPAPVDQIDWLVKKIKAAEKLGDMSMARRLKRKLEDC